MSKKIQHRLHLPTFHEIQAEKIEDRYSVEVLEKIVQLAGVREHDKKRFTNRCLGVAWQLCHDLEQDKMPRESEQRKALEKFSSSLRKSLLYFHNIDEISHNRLEVTAAYRTLMQDTPAEMRGTIWSEQISFHDGRGGVVEVHEGFPPSCIEDDENSRLKAVFQSVWHKTPQGFTHINKGFLIADAVSAIEDLAAWAEITAECTPVKIGCPPEKSIKKAIASLKNLWEIYRKATISRDSDKNTKKGRYIEFLKIILIPILPEEVRERCAVASKASEITYPRKGSKKNC